MLYMGQKYYLDEGPSLCLPPSNVVGMIEMVPDVDHLPINLRNGATSDIQKMCVPSKQQTLEDTIVNSE